MQLIAALAWFAAPAAADPGVEASLRVYRDDDDMTVVSPSVAAEAALGATTITADVTADAVTGASVDVVTSASPHPIDERRVELGLGVARLAPRMKATTLGLTARASHERDHDALRLGGSVRREALRRQLTWEARYLGGADAIGSAVDARFTRTRTVHQAALRVTAVIDPRSVVEVVVEGTATSGYQASPYRRVPIVDAAWPTPAWVDEAVPEDRRAIAVAGGVRRAIADDWFVAGGYRAYADDWAITSHTATVSLRHQLAPRLLIGALARGYVQDAAAFYRASYDAPAALRTRDRTLGPMRTAFASLTADVALAEDGWRVRGTCGVLASWFPEFPLQADRLAGVLTVSLVAPLGEGDE